MLYSDVGCLASTLVFTLMQKNDLFPGLCWFDCIPQIWNWTCFFSHALTKQPETTLLGKSLVTKLLSTTFIYSTLVVKLECLGSFQLFITLHDSPTFSFFFFSPLNERSSGAIAWREGYLTELFDNLTCFFLVFIYTLHLQAWSDWEKSKSWRYAKEKTRAEFYINVHIKGRNFIFWAWIRVQLSEFLHEQLLNFVKFLKLSDPSNIFVQVLSYDYNFCLVY